MRRSVHAATLAARQGKDGVARRGNRHNAAAHLDPGAKPVPKGGSPWTLLGGRSTNLDAELFVGLYELKSVGDMWRNEAFVSHAIEFGGMMESYASKALAPPSRCRLWERFRTDLEGSIRTLSGDKEAVVLMMGGVAQGMATVDGDVDLAIYLPGRIAEFQQDRSAVQQSLHVIGRGLKRQGFDGIVIPARVPIIQYRPDSDIERLFCMEGSDESFRYLKSKVSQGMDEAKKLAEKLATTMQCEVVVRQIHRKELCFEFPLAADAFSCMYHHPKQFELFHLTDEMQASPTQAELFTSLKELGCDKGGAAAPANVPDRTKEEKKDDAKALVTIDDILKTAAKGRMGYTRGAYIPYPFAADISLSVTDQPWGPRNSELLRRYLSSDPKTRILAMFVKWWSKHSVPVAINNSRSGWLTSYCVLAMLVHYLIHAGRLEFIEPTSIQAVLKPDSRYPCTTPLSDNDKLTIVHDFIGFCEFYATGFDYDKNVITLVSKGPKSRDESTAKVLSARNTAVIIEDPYEDRSLGHPINAEMLLQIRATFLAGARAGIHQVTQANTEDLLRKEMEEVGRSLLDSHFRFKDQPNDQSCSVCKAEPAQEEGDVCAECDMALIDAAIPLQYFCRRADIYQEMVEEVHIHEQKKQERALRSSQFSQKHHRGYRGAKH